jgi:predicted dehydrogenase
MSKVGFGLIGCGTWGRMHARAYAASPAIHLVAVCDQDASRAATLAAEFGISEHMADWRELIARPDIQAVGIATPDFAHGEITLAALRAGKHVLVEKPLATSISECEEILAVQKAQGVKLMVDFHNRWSLPFVNMRRAIVSGQLGSIMMMNMRLNDTRFVPTKMLSWAAKSSPLQFLGSHVVDLIRFLTGAAIERVYSVSRSVVLKGIGIDTPDFFQSILELSSGGTAVVENCWILDEHGPSVFDFQCEVVGSRGTAYVNASHHRMAEVYSDKGVEFPDVAAAADLYGKPVGFAVAAIQHFVDCVVNDQPLMVTGEDGLAAARVLAAAEQSAQTRLPVKVSVS